MSEPFLRLSHVLREGSPEAFPCSEADPPEYRRLAQVIAAKDVGRFRTDLVGLLRHVLRGEAERVGAPSPLLLRRDVHPWCEVDASMWRRGSIRADVDGPYLRITAETWRPGWLRSDDPPGRGAFAGRVKRQRASRVGGDPFLQDLSGFPTYASPGQKQAVRAALYASDYLPGSTLCVTLPTGSGKSLIAHLPAFHGARNHGVSLVIVPTVALALDQERAFLARARELGLHDVVPSRLAYYGDMPADDKRALLERVAEGTQVIVFLSPEALVTSFAKAAYRAAERGYLRYLVIDEAHLVAQWGAGFRPEFQSLAGFRLDLLRHGPPSSRFVTILMTATLTDEGFETLHALFSEPHGFYPLPAAQLRPEPEYFAAYCHDESVRRQRVVEAVWNLPRPVIVYTTKRQDALETFACLRDEGFERIAMMTGDTPDAERERIVRAWDEQRLDVVVATSAFGVGINNPHVRTVIHACIPENLDRFYQEVGRGGRDGRESVSLVLYTRDDYRVARSMTESFITVERGLERWRAMLLSLPNAAATEPGDDRIAVTLDARPSDLHFNSVRNRGWNVRTLNLMARAGMIRLDWRQAPDRGRFTDHATYNQAIEDFLVTRYVKILDGGHLDPRRWEEKVGPAREVSLQREKAGFDSMREFLEIAVRGGERRELDAILRRVYTVDVRLESGKRVRFSPQPLPPIPAPLPVAPRVPTVLERLAQGRPTIGVRIQGSDSDEDLGMALALCIEQGVRNLVVIGDAISCERLEALYSRTRIAFFVETDASSVLNFPRCATAVVLPRKHGSVAPVELLRMLPAPNVLLFPDGTMDAERPHIALHDTLGVAYSLPRFIERLL